MYLESFIKDARFILSSPDLKRCSVTKLPEFAFIGRSNVGKSSLINMLTNKKKLAKTSATPGKTRLINHFLVNESWYLVDLPGYGYAKASKEERSGFQQTILEYITKRETLYCLFVLIDARISPQAIDIKFINWLGENQVPFTIVFTKTDKISQREWQKNVDGLKNLLKESWEELPHMIFSSALKKLGREEILSDIQKALNK
jgi:GTP-binding protein